MMAFKVPGGLAIICLTAFGSGGTAERLRFEPNAGQTSPAVSFLARSQGRALFFSPCGVTVRTAKSVWKMDLVGANPGAQAIGLEPLQAQAHYLTGLPERWHTGLAAYSRIEFHDVYPGVDIIYHGDGSNLQYDLLLKPGASPSQIMLHFEGSDPRIDANGDLILSGEGGDWRHRHLEAYQIRDGMHAQVTTQFVAVGPREVSISPRGYDPLAAMALNYSTYLGGTGQDSATSVAVDASGNTYIAGWTESTDFPETAGTRIGRLSNTDAYVAKLSPSGSLLYITYLGGSGADQALGIAVDGSGEAVIVGVTNSSDFPVVNAIQASPAGGQDAFIVKLNAAGNGLVFSTYLGGSGSDSANGVALDAQGNIYAAGETTSANFPVQNPLQSQIGGGDDAFVSKFSSAGARIYSTFLGGSANDRATAIAVDGSGYAYITGSTYSSAFPVRNAFQATCGGGQDAFVAKIGPAGNSLIYSTYIGGSGGAPGAPETGNGIAVDLTGAAYVTGGASSSNFPISNPLQSFLKGSEDAFILKLNPAGNALVYSTYLGGSGFDVANGIAIDGAGNAYVAGDTTSTDFPIANAVQSSSGGGYDAFVARLNSSGTSLDLSTYFGGAKSDSIYAIALDAGGKIYIAGQTLSSNFPASGAIQFLQPSPASTFTAEMPALTSGLRFVAVAPCRVADTRNSAGPFGGPSITGGSIRDFAITSSPCGIPTNAQTYSLNISVVPQGPLGYLTAWASGQAQPLVSVLNSLDGRVKAAAAFVPAGIGGKISIFASNTSDVVIDINGYFVPAGTANSLAFYPVTPCRIADTRSAAGPFGGPALAGGQGRTFPMQSSACSIPGTAQAYSLNITAVPAGPLGFISAWPTGTAQPLVSTLNALTGVITGNAAIVPAGLNGSIDIFASNSTNLVIDITGYFADASAGGLSLYNVAPCRVLDTRLQNGSVPISGVNNLDLTSNSCNIPSSAQVFVLNATVVPVSVLGFLTLWPQGESQPLVSTLNAVDGAVTSNLAIVPSVNGWISAFLTQPSHLILDTSGYFSQ